MPPIYTLDYLPPKLDINERVAIWEYGRNIGIKKFDRIWNNRWLFKFLGSGLDMGHFVPNQTMVIKLTDFLNQNQIDNLCNIWEHGDIDQKYLVSQLLHTKLGLPLEN